MYQPDTKKQIYADMTANLLELKRKQTFEKLENWGYTDEDDYGNVVLPKDFKFEPILDPTYGTFHGNMGWATNYYKMMCQHPVYINPEDAIAGKWMIKFGNTCPKSLFGASPDAKFSYAHLVEEQKLYGITSGIGATAHFAPDYKIGLELGWGGLLAKIRSYPATEFRLAEELVILGIQNWIDRHIARIEELLATAENPVHKENLTEMLACNKWVRDGAPRTFREACQWICWFNMASRIYDRDGAGGQIDALLQPYYDRDVAAGVLDEEDAVYLTSCFLLNDPHYYQLAGPDENGNDQTCKMSYIFLEAAHRMKISANLTVRVHDGLDPELFRTGIRNLLTDRSGCPRFSGDKALVAGFMKNGYSAEIARTRIAVGCHWMAIPGREYTLNDCVKINMAKVFEVAYYEVAESASPSLEALWESFEKHLRKAVLCTAKGLDFHLEHMHENMPELLINLLCYGPIEKNLDASHGGVEFYNMCVDGAGIAVVADSLAAIEQRIVNEKVLTWDACVRATKTNFEGMEGEKIRRMMQASDRYGAGNSLGDKWAVKISRLFSDIVHGQRTPGGRIMIPGLFSWSSTIGFGKQVGATPNGRYAYAPVNHGANPLPGFRKDGAFTAAAKAIASVQSGYGNTAPFQLELNVATSDLEADVERIGAVIKTHCDLGGTLINVNLVDENVIREAHKDPTKFPDLVVRVTGFTAYFISLSPEFRQLVVDRIIGE